MRVLVYGMVVLLAAGVLAVRAVSQPEGAGRGGASALYHGQTPEGLAAALSVSDGEVHQAYMRWRMTCERGHEPYISTVTFKQRYGDRFERDGRRFATGGRKDQDAGGGETIRFDVRVSGELSENGLSASGSGQTTETWLRHGRVTDVCRSERVPWTVHRGMPVNR
jgi:hypothetical protein